MKGTKPTKTLVGGDRTAAKRFIGPANSQMEILKKQMSFQNRSQGVRRLWLYDDVYVECIKCFNYQECKIWVRPVVPEVEEETKKSGFFLVLFSTDSGNEVVVWDLSRDSVFMEKKTFSEIQEKFEEEEIPFEVQEAKYPKTDNYTWDVTSSNVLYDSPVILPNYLHNFYDDGIGYVRYSTYLYPSKMTYDVLGYVETISWSLDYVDKSPLPYPHKETIYEGDPYDEDDEKSSYISTFNGVVTEDSSLVSEFVLLTETPWPGTEEDPVVVERTIQFWHPFFWYSVKDEQGSYQRLSNEYRGIQILDTWDDGVWEEGGNLVRESRTLSTGGVATKTDEEGTVESLVFEYVGVCHEVDPDTFSYTDMCDPEAHPYDEYFRIYEHGKNKLTSMRKTILDGTNSYRTNDLVYNSVLADAAQRHADDQAKVISEEGSDALSHQGSDGSWPLYRIEDAGYYLWVEYEDKADEGRWGWTIGENNAYTEESDNPAAHVVDLWRASPGHYANMINEDFSELGIGISSTGGGGYVFVQNFGKVDHRYPGFSPFNPENLKSYVDDNFLFDPEHEDTRQPRMYLLGSVSLSDEQARRLQK